MEGKFDLYKICLWSCLAEINWGTWKCVCISIVSQNSKCAGPWNSFAWEKITYLLNELFSATRKSFKDQHNLSVGHLSCMHNTMAADDLVTWGTRSSAAMVLTHFPRESSLQNQNGWEYIWQDGSVKRPQLANAENYPVPALNCQK